MFYNHVKVIDYKLREYGKILDSKILLNNQSTINVFKSSIYQQNRESLKRDENTL